MSSFIDYVVNPPAITSGLNTVNAADVSGVTVTISNALVGKFTSQGLSISAGVNSPTAPSFYWGDDTDTGFFKVTDDLFAVTAGGSLIALFGQAGYNSVGNVIQNLGTPTQSGDAATKGYTDSLFLSGFSSGSASSPGIKFLSQTNTGFFYSTDTLGITTQGTERVRLTSQGLGFAGTSFSASTPSLYWSTDPDTGLFKGNADEFGMSAGGSVSMIATSTGINSVGNRIVNVGSPISSGDAATKSYVDNAPAQGWVDGSAAAPGGYFLADTDTGIYRSGSSVGVTVNSTPTLLSSASGTSFYNGVLVEDGNASTPSIRFQNDTNTGFFRYGTDSIGFSAGGSTRLTVDSTQALSFVPLKLSSSGSSGSPALLVGNNTGLYRRSQNTVEMLCVSTEGVERLTIGSLGLGLSNDQRISWPLGFIISGTSNMELRYNNNSISMDANVTSLTKPVNYSINTQSASAPSIYFRGASSSGIYSPTSNTVSISSQSVEHLRVNNTEGVVVTTMLKTPIISVDDGTVGLPSYTFTSEPTSGMWYVDGLDAIVFSILGVAKLSIFSNAIGCNNSQLTQVGAPTSPSHAATKAYVDAAIAGVGGGGGGVTSMADGNVASPGWAFTSYPSTGFYKEGTNGIGISVNGSAGLTITTTGLSVFNKKISNLATPTLSTDAANKSYVDNAVAGGSGGVTNMASGTSANPGWAFSAVPTTGFYKDGTDGLGISISGTSALTINTSGISVLNKRVTNLANPINTSDATTKSYVDAAIALGGGGGATSMPSGSASSPGWNFASQSNTGLYLSGSSDIGFSANGSSSVIVRSTGTYSVNGYTSNNGTISLPSYRFENDVDTGMFLPSVGNLGFSVGSASILNISSSDLTATRPIRVPVGSSSTPAYSFAGDTDTGIFSESANEVNVAVGGNKLLSITQSNMQIHDGSFTIPKYNSGMGTIAPLLVLSGDDANKTGFVVDTTVLPGLNIFESGTFFGSIYSTATNSGINTYSKQFTLGSKLGQGVTIYTDNVSSNKRTNFQVSSIATDSGGTYITANQPFSSINLQHKYSGINDSVDVCDIAGSVSSTSSSSFTPSFQVGLYTRSGGTSTRSTGLTLTPSVCTLAVNTLILNNGNATPPQLVVSGTSLTLGIPFNPYLNLTSTGTYINKSAAALPTTSQLPNLVVNAADGKLMVSDANVYEKTDTVYGSVTLPTTGTYAAIINNNSVESQQYFVRPSTRYNVTIEIYGNHTGPAEGYNIQLERDFTIFPSIGSFGNAYWDCKLYEGSGMTGTTHNALITSDVTVSTQGIFDGVTLRSIGGNTLLKVFMITGRGTVFTGAVGGWLPTKLSISRFNLGTGTNAGSCEATVTYHECS